MDLEQSAPTINAKSRGLSTTMIAMIGIILFIAVGVGLAIMYSDVMGDATDAFWTLVNAIDVFAMCVTGLGLLCCGYMCLTNKYSRRARNVA